MKGILKQLATLTIMAALVLCLLPMSADAVEYTSPSYTDSGIIEDDRNTWTRKFTFENGFKIETSGIGCSKDGVIKHRHKYTIVEDSVKLTVNASGLTFSMSYSFECDGVTYNHSISKTWSDFSCATTYNGSGAGYGSVRGTATNGYDRTFVQFRLYRDGTAHSFDQAAGNGVCTVCGNNCPHNEKTPATCTDAEKCNACGKTFGEADSNAHDYAWTYSNGTHIGTCRINATHTTECVNCTRGEDGKCTVCQTALVASLTSGDTTTYYKTVDEAFAAAQAAGSGTVTVLANAAYAREGNIIYSDNISLVVNSNVTLTLNKSLYMKGRISGGGTIADFQNRNNALITYDGSTIEGITATARLNITGGTIFSGIFTGEVQNGGTIKGGTFSGMVYNNGTIEGGTFSETVVNHSYSYESWAGTISGGTFNYTVENTPGTIKGGTFNGQLTNKPYSGNEGNAKATVDADKLTLGENFSFTNQGGTVICTTHQRTTPATCMAPETCIFCGHTEGEKDNTAHSLIYSVATDTDNTITETCAHGCTHSATATLNITEGNFTYNGQPHNVAFVAYTETWKGGDLTVQYADNDNVNAGTRTATIQIDEATATKEFTINKATPTGSHFTITLPQNAVYDGTAKAVTVTAADGITGMGTISIAYCKGTEPLNETPTGAGNYTVDLTIAEGDNFTSASLKSAAGFTIAKAETVKTAPVAITGLVYDSTPKALITAGEASDAAKAAGYKMMYMLEKEGAVYTDTVPTATDAGTYKIIWYAGYDNDNFKLNSGTMEVTIAKADTITAAPTANTLTYNSKPQQLVSGGTSNWGSIEYKLDNGNWSMDIPTATNAGDYTVYYRIQLGENFNNVAETAIPVELAPFNFATATAGNAKIGLLGTPFVYDGTAKTGTPSATIALPNPETGPALIEVKLTEGTDFTVAYENNVKAGTLTATFTGKGNYTGVVTRNYEIGKATLTLSVENQTITYGKEIDQTKYTVTGLASGDTATVKLTPSTANITKSGTITAAVTIKNAAGEDVTACYTTDNDAATLTINPDLSAIEGLTVDNVHYSDEEAIKKLQTDLNTATTDTDTQTAINDAKVKCAQLLTQIDASKDALDTDEINATLKTTASNVKLEDRANVEKAITDIEAAKTNYGKNYSETDIAALDAQSAKLKAALEAIKNAEDVIEKLNELPADVEPDDAIEAKEVYEDLTANEKVMVTSKAAAKVAALTNYKIVKGNAATWETGKTLTFTINGDCERFKRDGMVKVDGKVVDDKYYEAEEGSTIVTLEKSFFEQKSISSKATHEIIFMFGDGEVRGTFYIHKDAMTPATGDTSGIVVWTVVLFASSAALAGLYIASRKKNRA